MAPVQVFFAKTRPVAILPHKRDEDAGYDIFACLENDYIIFEPHQTQRIPTGIASAFPKEYYFHIAERSSTGNLGISQRCGVVDSGYRGEWFLSLTNLNSIPLVLVRGDARESAISAINGRPHILYSTDHAIAQALLLPVPTTEITEIPLEDLRAMKSARGTNANGSTNKGSSY